MRNLVLSVFLFISQSFCFSQSANEIYKLAYQQLNEGVNAAEVLQTLQNCIEKDENHQDAYLLRAFIYYKLDDFEAAIKDYNSLIEINPKHEEALKKRAITKVRVKDYKGAIEDHNLRLEIDPDNSVIYFDRAYCKGMLNHDNAAIDDYSKAIELNPEYIAAYVNRGIALLNQFLAANNNQSPTIEEAEFICEDFQMAMILGDLSVAKYLQEYCTLK